MSNGGTYDPHSIEPRIYEFWEKAGYFHAEPDANRKPYVIDIPLPNVTGSLHLGHALNNTLQDTLTRRARMLGFNAMWMPGTDHAGIATQAVVEKKLRENEGITRHELGREGLVERIWQWKEEYGGRILKQLRRIGASCDWERTRFTLDEVCAKAVFEAFFRYFKDGLIYRGLRLVNWDAHLQTAVADDEIVHETVQGHLWHYRYPVLQKNEVTEKPGDDVGEHEPLTCSAEIASAAIARAVAEDAEMGRDYLSIATTRPETMLGDSAIAVHPEDERYKHLIGQYVLLPLQNHAIPVIADGLLVKPEFGTGCVKVTPGHDPNDYACGKRHNLPETNILTIDGQINENGGQYAGQDRNDVRKQIVKDLEEIGLLEKVEPYTHEVGHSDRSKTPIEPMLSEQWFLKMADLCELAMGAVRDGRVKFFPERYAKTYLDWLGEKRDWCISRQLWWGHRIPVWTHTGECDDAKAKEIRGRIDEYIERGLIAHQPAEDGSDSPLSGCFCLAQAVDEEFRTYLAESGFEQDPDVLDTWFSSALWPFSTLGWPDQNPDLDYFYPTSVLVTGRDIITLWVARMVMSSLYFNNVVPFDHVHIHPNIQDGQGRRMSKSTGNGVDPVDLIDLYGTDAMRFTLVQMASETQDARMPVSYHCPHCGGLTPQDSVVPKGKTPAEVHKVKCKECKQPFATVWATKELKDELGVARDTSDRFELGRNFCNKLWQASTGFVMANLEGYAPRDLKREDLAIEDQWILSRLSACIEEVNRRYDRYQFNEIANTLYAFFWSEFCDWYVELVKPRLFARNAAGETETLQGESAQTARQVLAWVLDQTLRMLHPMMPFITEELWARLNEIAPQRGIDSLLTPDKALIITDWPDAAAWKREAGIEGDMQALQDVIRTLRETRNHVNGIRSAAQQSAVRTLPKAVIRAEQTLAATLREREPMILRLGQVDEVEIGADVTKPPESSSKVLSGIEVYVPLSGLADLDIERKRLSKELQELTGHLKRLEAKLSNEGFVAKAPAEVVERERERLTELRDKIVAVERNLKEISA